jgi:hypothetical protein
LAYLGEVKIAADRFVLDQLHGLWEYLENQLTALDKELRRFARQAPVREQEARAVLESIPIVGDVTVDVVVSEVGDVRRFVRRSGSRLMRAWRRHSAHRQGARRSWASAKKARGCCAGPWSKPPGGWCGTAGVGGMPTSNS